MPNPVKVFFSYSGTAAPATPSPSTASGGLTDRQRRRLEQERDSVQQQYDRVSEKLDRLRQAQSIETDVAVKMKLEVQMQETTAELNQLDGKLEEVEQKLV